MFAADENAEDKMSDALVFGCIAVAVIVLATIGVVATLLKVWL